ncbi:MAG TPA: hypothetical protein VE734_05090 [Terriglobales bacterium]|jgi:FtsH-binding integral membrane protein|nr:hypothetical protein [Terriglobales bacterium]
MANEILGWAWVLGALIMGLYVGVKFQREDWLGGYGTLPRRMVRLAHVALAALGILNIEVGHTLPHTALPATLARSASSAFIAAAISMPACCLWIASGRQDFSIFALPAGCLAIGLVLILGGLLL